MFKYKKADYFDSIDRGRKSTGANRRDGMAEVTAAHGEG